MQKVNPTATHSFFSRVFIETRIIPKSGPYINVFLGYRSQQSVRIFKTFLRAESKFRTSNPRCLLTGEDLMLREAGIHGTLFFSLARTKKNNERKGKISGTEG
jgi:hypothetical protein